MCAIAGILEPGLTGTASLSCSLQRMAHAMIHRSPEEEGSFVALGIGLLHRRLSIVTICNGEFFDHVEKRAWLQA